MRVLLFIIGLAGAGILGYVAVPKLADKIEDDVRYRLGDMLGSQKYPSSALFDVDGRTVTLKGTVDTQDAKNRFTALAGDVTGVRVVHNHLEVPQQKKAEPGGAEPAFRMQPNLPFNLNVESLEVQQAPKESPENSSGATEPFPEQVETETTETTDSEEDAVNDSDIIIFPSDFAGRDAYPQDTGSEETASEESDADGSASQEDILENVDPDLVVTPIAEPSEQDLLPAGNIATDSGDNRPEPDKPDKDVSAAGDCQAKINDLIGAQKIFFESGKTRIDRQSLPLLDDLVSEMTGCEDVALHIHGYTDNVGEQTANQAISHARAKAVGLYLLKQGVRQRIKIFGHGENDPIAGNETAQGRSANRRIEFEAVPAKVSVANDNDDTKKTIQSRRSIRIERIVAP